MKPVEIDQSDENVVYTVYIDSVKGCITLHSQTEKKYFSKCRSVKLFFNSQTKEIMIRPAGEGDSECSALSHSVISALRKFRNNNVKVLTGNYKAEWDSIIHCLVVKPANYLGTVKNVAKPLTVRMDKEKWYILLHMQTLKAHFFNCEYVEFSFDRKTERVKIQPVTDRTPQSVSLEYPSGRMQFYNFVTLHMISLENFQSGNYSAIWDEEQKCLVIEPGNYLGEPRSTNTT